MTLSTVDKSTDRVREMFGQIAPKYDRMNHLLSLNVDRYWRWRTVRMVPANGDSPILDLCTGTGDLAFAYWRATQGRVPIIAADFCPEMLEVGRTKKTKYGVHDEIEFTHADAEALPWDDNRFQLACVAFGLRNVAHTDRGLAEMTRVVQPGGKVVVLEFSKPARPPFSWIYGWYFTNVLPRIGQIMAKNDADAYDYLPASVGEFPCGEALAELMRKVGLREVWYRPLTFGIATLYVGTK